jgi:4-pyridoxolactonase
VRPTKVFILDGGSIVVDGFHIFWNRGPGGDVRIPCYSVLVDHPDGLLLYDSGFDLDHVQAVLPFEKPLQTEQQTIPGQLAVVGVRPEDVSRVVNSHFHFDHCGGNKWLPAATFFCHETEYRAAQNPQPFEHLGYSDLSFSPGLREGEGAPQRAGSGRFELVRDDTEIMDGVWLLETPGHSAGHYSLLVEMEHTKAMLFTGDACFGPKNLEFNCISSFHVDPVEGIRSLERIRKLGSDGKTELFFSHDQGTFDSYLKAPAFYH